MKCIDVICKRSTKYEKKERSEVAGGTFGAEVASVRVVTLNRQNSCDDDATTTLKECLRPMFWLISPESKDLYRIPSTKVSILTHWYTTS